MNRFLRKVQVLSRRLITEDQRASLVEFAEEIIALLEADAPLGSTEGREARGRNSGRGRRDPADLPAETIPGAGVYD
jgi:hypothetical protein